MTYIHITLLVLLVISCINAIIVTLSPQTKRKTAATILNKKVYEKTRDKEKNNLIILYVVELRFKEKFNEKAFFKIPSLLQTFYLADGFYEDMKYDNFLEFIICNSKQLISKTIISLNKIGAIKSKELLIESIEILQEYGETIESIQEKEGYTIQDIIVESDFERNNELIEEFNKLDELYHQQTENIKQLNLAYFEKHKEELWVELK